MSTLVYTKPKMTSLKTTKSKPHCKKVFCKSKYVSPSGKHKCGGYCEGKYAAGTFCPRSYSS